MRLLRLRRVGNGLGLGSLKTAGPAGSLGRISSSFRHGARLMRARLDGRYGPKTITSSLSSGAVASAILIVGPVVYTLL